MSNVIALYFVPTNYNVADVLTKPLVVDQFEYLCNILMRGHGGIEPTFSEEVHVALTAISIIELDNSENVQSI